MTQAYQSNSTPQTKSGNAFCVFFGQRAAPLQEHGGIRKLEKTRRKSERLAFPLPTQLQTEAIAFICSTDRILALYNKQRGKAQKRFTCTVRDWFAEAAYEAGWTEVEFLENYQTGRIGGCRLFSQI